MGWLCFDYSKGSVPYTFDGKDWKQIAGKGWHDPGFAQDETHPVTCVSWEDAVAFCEWLSRKEGKTYRLPTDHEWSCAVGIGGRENATTSPDDKSGKIPNVYPWGTSESPPSGYGNYADTTAKAKFPDFTIIKGYTDGYAATAPVMSFPSGRSRDGLYDLGGNVWEWCAGCYDGKDVLGKDKSLTSSRVLRGGSWNNNDRDNLASSNRNNNTPDNRNNNNGFRCVVVAGSSSPKPGLTPSQSADGNLLPVPCQEARLTHAPTP